MKNTTTRNPRFDKEWTEMIALLPEHRRAVVEESISRYQLHCTEPSGLEGAERIAFLLIKKIVDRRAKMRESRRRRNQRAVSSTDVEKPVAEGVRANHPDRSPSEPAGLDSDLELLEIDDDGFIVIRNDADMTRCLKLERQGGRDPSMFTKYRFV